MVDNLALAEESIIRELDILNSKKRSLERILADIRSNSAANCFTVLPVQPDEYKGMKVTRALENYLRARRGMRIPLSRAAHDLVAGGVPHGKPRGRKSDSVGLVEQSLKIGLPYLTRIFSWEPMVQTTKGLPGVPKGVDSSVWLAQTADEPVQRKPSPKKKTSRKSTDEAAPMLEVRLSAGPPGDTPPTRS